MPVWDRGAASFSTNRSSAKPGYLSAQAGFIDEGEARRIEIELAVKLVAATLQEVGTILLQCMCGLF